MERAKTIAIANLKGGVAKTVTVNSLAAALVQEGKKVLCIDNDPQGSLTMSFGVMNPDELEYTLPEMLQAVVEGKEPDFTKGVCSHGAIDYIPSNIGLESFEIGLVTAMAREQVLKSLLRHVESRYNYILIDCRPTLGVLTLNALTAADEVIIPSAADLFGVKGLQYLIGNIFRIQSMLNPTLKIKGILLTLCERNRFTREIQELVNQVYGSDVHVFDITIPKTIRVKEAIGNAQTIFEYKKSPELNKVIAAYTQLGKEVLGNDK
jgi:chromosome partitioning protein